MFFLSQIMLLVSYLKSSPNLRVLRFSPVFIVQFIVSLEVGVSFVLSHSCFGYCKTCAFLCESQNHFAKFYKNACWNVFLGIELIPYQSGGKCHLNNTESSDPLTQSCITLLTSSIFSAVFHCVQYVGLALLLPYLSQIFNIFYASPKNNRSNHFFVSFWLQLLLFLFKDNKQGCRFIFITSLHFMDGLQSMNLSHWMDI